MTNSNNKIAMIIAGQHELRTSIDWVVVNIKTNKQ